MTVIPALADALARSDRLYDRAQIQHAIGRMAAEIGADYAGTRPLFLTVMHGGMLFAAELALALGEIGLDLEMEYLHATRYRGATAGAELQWKHRPSTPLRGRRVLLVDDIVDEGHTLSIVREWCRGEGASDVRIAAMTVKRHDRCVPGLAADYFGLYVPDRYVYGYGMDYHEQGRNLPAIHALRGRE
jgi:hypoxanthine phosphoribosyltransferase